MHADRSVDSEKVDLAAKAKKIKKERRRELADTKKDNRSEEKESQLEQTGDQDASTNDILSELERKSELLSTAMGRSSTDIFAFLNNMMDCMDDDSLKGPVYLHKNAQEAKVIFYEEAVL